MNLDAVDRNLLQLLQDEFPLEPCPWEVLGRRLDLSGEDTLNRVRNLHDAGILRGICPILESGKAGIGASTLAAAKVPPERVGEAARIISGYPQVSHNYLRDHPYNIWFTLAARDREEIGELLAEIRDRCRLCDGDLIELPVKRRFKIDVRFPIASPEGNRE